MDKRVTARSLLEMVRRAEPDRTVIVNCDAADQPVTTYGQLAELVDRARESLTGWQARSGDVVGICGENSAQWVAWDVAAADLGIRLMPFAEPMSVEAAAAAMVEYDLSLFLLEVDTGAALVPGVVDFGGSGSGQARPATGRWASLDDDVHSLIFSSGTAGTTKGLEVSWQGTEYVVSRFVRDYALDADDMNLIFIPFVSYQQRLSVYAALASGSAVALTSYKRVFAAMQAAEPTFLIGPPVFFETLLKLASARDPRTGLQQSTGPRMRFMVTGMAPIKQSVVQSFWDQGRPLLEAYGMNESGMIAWNTPTTHRLGTVGRLLDSDHVAIVDGELLVKREFPLSRRYFQADAHIAEATYRDDGTIASGDLAAIDSDGYVTLHGRVGDLVALPNGEKVSPVDVESAYADIDGVSDIVVCAGGPGRRLAAVVTLDDGSTIENVRAALDARASTLADSYRLGNLVPSDTSPRVQPEFLTANLKLSRVAVQRFVDAHLHS
ncbi:MAG: hypothetical protein QOE23_2066 [Pseudonocardiales bacterium]|nr:hypothetical protein [Pseudonocardiales bacterium]